MANKETGHPIRLKLSLADQVGVALHQNPIPVLNALVLENRLGRDLWELKLGIRSEPPLTVATSWRIDEPMDGKSLPVVNSDVQLDVGYLNKLMETGHGSLRLALREGETEIARESLKFGSCLRLRGVAPNLPKNFWRCCAAERSRDVARRRGKAGG